MNTCNNQQENQTDTTDSMPSAEPDNAQARTAQSSDSSHRRRTMALRAPHGLLPRSKQVADPAQESTTSTPQPQVTLQQTPQLESDRRYPRQNASIALYPISTYTRECLKDLREDDTRLFVSFHVEQVSLLWGFSDQHGDDHRQAVYARLDTVGRYMYRVWSCNIAGEPVPDESKIRGATGHTLCICRFGDVLFRPGWDAEDGTEDDCPVWIPTRPFPEPFRGTRRSRRLKREDASDLEDDEDDQEDAEDAEGDDDESMEE